MKWTRLPSPNRFVSDLLTREMVEIKDRFTVAYLESAVMSRANQPYITKPVYRSPIQNLPFTIVCKP
jgi:hypothetical protein